MLMRVTMTSEEVTLAIRQWLDEHGVPNGAGFDVRHDDYGPLQANKLSVTFSVETPHMEGPYR